MIVHIRTVHKKIKDLHDANLRIAVIPKKMPPSFKCQLCKEETKIFSSRGDLYGHYSLCHYREDIMTFVSESDLACPICFKCMPEISGLLKHVGGAHDKVELFLPKEYHIKRTRAGASNTKILLRTVRTIKKRKKPSKSMKCKLCPDSRNSWFVSRSLLYKHYSLKHYRNELSVNVEKESLSCKICGKKFSKIEDVIKHIGLTHNRVNAFLPEEFRIEKLRPRRKNDQNHNSPDSPEKEKSFTEIESSSPVGGRIKTKPFDAMMLNCNDGKTMATELDTDLSADSEPMVEDSHNLLDTENNINTLDPIVDCRIDIERLHYHFKHRKLEPNLKTEDVIKVEPNFHTSDDVKTACKSEYFEEDTKIQR